jgi:hypothetical protein
MAVHIPFLLLHSIATSTRLAQKKRNNGYRMPNLMVSIDPIPADLEVLQLVDGIIDRRMSHKNFGPL